MRVALTTSGNDLDAPLDSYFGRASKFLIYYTDTAVFSIKDNDRDPNSVKDEGIYSALHLFGEHVDCVIARSCGIKAYETLAAAGIAVYICKDVTVKQAIEKLRLGELDEIQETNVEANWA